MSVIRRLLFLALLVPLNGGQGISAAEFEVLDRFSVDGYSVLRGSADIPGGGFAVGGSSFVVKGGNVGIGTTSPGVSLHIGADNTNGRLYLAGPSSGASPLTTGRPTNDNAQLMLGRAGTSDGGGIEFMLSPSGSGWGWKINAPDADSRTDLRIFNRHASAGWSEKMTIQGATGNFGIGTTNPSAKLDVAGNILLSGAGPTITYNSGGPTIAVPAAGTLAIGTAGTERMRIDSTGNVGIGTTSPGASLHVVSANTVSSAFKVQTGSIPGTEVVISTSGSLDVAGGIKVGTVTASCALAIAGTLRWYGGHISVCNGTSWRQLDNQPPPTISVINPASGLVSGGTPITISGSGFNFGLEVLIDGVAATVTGLTASQITVTTPVSLTGTGSKNVNISNPDGQYCSGAFTYYPFITNVLPASGPQTTVITITGGGFAAGAGVKIGTIDADNIIRDSETQLRAAIPAGYIGGDIKDVTVINGDATSAVKSGGFTYKIYATGGDITTVSGYRIHTFITGTVNKTLTFTTGGNVEVLVVAGGGGGANTGSGGGAGGYYSNASFAVTPQAYTVTVGDGGAGGNTIGGPGSKGANSIFSTITAEGGGAGASHGNIAGGNGGSGAGGPIKTVAPASTGGTGSQGNAGGAGMVSAGWNGNSGGGGGAGAVGGAGGNTAGTGNGGAGLGNSISGSLVYYAGGGGGGEVAGSYVGVGGIGGGGNANIDTVGSNGTANTGGGGGGGSYTGTYFNGGNGGSGIVIIRYPN